MDFTLNKSDLMLEKEKLDKSKEEFIKEKTIEKEKLDKSKEEFIKEKISFVSERDYIIKERDELSKTIEW